MRGVVAPAHQRAAPRERARQRHEGGVEDRDQQDQHREEGGRDQPALHVRGRADAGGREEATDQEAAAVAHENAAGRKVVAEEAEHRAGERGDRHGQRAGVLRHQQREVAERGDRRHARRQPVHVVEQVERVGHADDPDEREQAIDRNPAGDRDRRHQPQDDRRDHHLPDQLRQRLHGADVVEHAEQEHQPGIERQRQEPLVRRMKKHAAGEPDCDGDPPEQRHRPPMPAIRGRERADVPAERQRADDRRRDQRQQEPGDEGGEMGRYGHVMDRRASAHGARRRDSRQHI